jgi:predicted regulator of Ras-like GTPase activity (Roadblock/LC7/MglB family)
MLPLSDLTEAWPDVLRQEIARWNLSKSIVALPLEFVEIGLKQGHISCSWKQLRAWIQPALAEPPISAHDAAVLSLPLKIIAPLFLAKQQAVKAQPKVAIDSSIPNLFFGAPQPEASVAPFTPVAGTPPTTPPVTAPSPQCPKPPDTNFYVWKDDVDAPVESEPVFKRGTPLPGTDFLKRYATPNEIVSRAAALEGVAGALISLPDGLLVASRIPPELNADTLAAFLPHIFGRVSQCTKELRMGELNNLNFTVSNVAWKMFKVGAIFFAAFGRVGEPLPPAQVAALASDLDHKPKELYGHHQSSN